MGRGVLEFGLSVVTETSLKNKITMDRATGTGTLRLTVPNCQHMGWLELQTAKGGGGVSPTLTSVRRLDYKVVFLCQNPRA